MAQTPKSDADGMVIFSGSVPWYASGRSLDTTTTKARGTRATGTTRTRASAKAQPTVIHPFFHEASSLTSDEYWQELLAKAAFDKLPRKFRVENGCLYYQTARNRYVECSLTVDNPAQVLEEVREFMGKHAGIMSEIDSKEREAMILQEAARASIIEISSWSSILQSQTRRTLLSIYALDLGKQHGLSHAEQLGLDCLIKFAVNAGYFDNHNITVSRGVITHIDGLQFDASNRCFDITDSTRAMCRPKRNGRGTEEDEVATVVTESTTTTTTRTKRSTLRFLTAKDA